MYRLTTNKNSKNLKYLKEYLITLLHHRSNDSTRKGGGEHVSMGMRYMMLSHFSMNMQVMSGSLI